MALTLHVLEACMPPALKESPEVYDARMNKFLDPLNQTIIKYDISTPERLRCFLAQLAHESGCLRYTRELADGSAYEGRKDLGNTQPGDGKKFKGRGLIQTTGRSNYLLTGTELGIDLIAHPEKLEEPLNAALSAGFYWKRNNLNAVCDQPETWTRTWKPIKGHDSDVYSRFEWLTVKINGGLNGYLDRVKYYHLCKKAIV